MLQDHAPCPLPSCNAISLFVHIWVTGTSGCASQHAYEQLPFILVAFNQEAAAAPGNLDNQVTM